MGVWFLEANHPEENCQIKWDRVANMVEKEDLEVTSSHSNKKIIKYL